MKAKGLKRIRLIAAAVAMSAAFSSNISLAAMASTAQVYLRGDPGSWVGGAVGAQSATWVHGVDGIFSTSSINNGIVSIGYQGDAYWTFSFAAPTYNPQTNTNTGTLLKVGLYQNATRYPFNSPTKPGMSISGNGRGDNTSIGWFNILDIAFDGSGNLARLAVDFKQFDETNVMSGPGIYGSLRFNDAGIPVNSVPVPAAAWLLGSGLVGLAGVARRKAA